MLPLYATTALPQLLGLGYLITGAGVALVLHRRGQSGLTSASALLCWPLLLGLLADTPESPGEVPRGPLADTIDAAFRSVVEVDEIDPADLRELRLGLGVADHRLLRVDRLLQEELPVSGLEAPLERLREARARAVAEIEGVLSGVVELRIQSGLLALEGDTGPVRERLAELKGRVAALEEITSLRRSA